MCDRQAAGYTDGMHVLNLGSHRHSKVDTVTSLFWAVRVGSFTQAVLQRQEKATCVTQPWPFHSVGVDDLQSVFVMKTLCQSSGMW